MDKQIDPGVFYGAIALLVVVMIVVSVRLFLGGQGTTERHAGDGKILPGHFRTMHLRHLATLPVQ